MDNSSLVLLWWLSLTLSAVALVMMLLLIAKRMISYRIERNHQLLVGIGIKAMLEALDGRSSAADVLKACRGRSVLLMDSALEIAALVRGPERERLSLLLEQLGTAERLRRQLRSWREATRRRAAERLVLFPRRETIIALTGALDDRAPPVRLAAAVSLAELDELPPLDKLLEELEVGTEVRSATLRILFRKLAREQPTQMVAALRRNPPAALKVLLLEALARSGSYAVADTLGRYCQDPDKEVRSEALRSLANLEHPDALSAVSHALQDKAWEVRVQAATAAGRAGFTSLIPALSRMLDDEVWWVQLRSAEALMTLGQAGIARLRELAADGASRSAQAAQLVLMERRVA
jgi:HEAT repeat protein